MAAAKQLELLRAGRRAPDFELPALEGGKVALRDLLVSGPVLLAFFKSSCPVCQLTLPFLERIYTERNPGSLAIYGISQDDPETTREFNQEFGMTLPMLLDTEESGYPVSNAYGLSHVPSLFLVERDGTIASSFDGFSKRDLTTIAGMAGVNPFRATDNVPDWKAG